MLLTVFQKVCDALAFAHSKGVIHLDLKPENLMLGDFGSVLVMDWGLAKVFATGGSQGSASPIRVTGGAAPSLVMSARAGESAFGNTMKGMIMGTPQYMAPEQARGEVETLDQRADIYALGVILFEILHLRAAVTARDAQGIVDRVARGEIEWGPPHSLGHHPHPAIPASLLAICHKALAADLAARYANVEALQADLLAYQNGFATSAEKAGLGKQLLLAVRRNKIAAAGVAAVLLVGVSFGTKAIVEGRRAERAVAKAVAETKRAELALMDLRKQAPALREFAESEAAAQRFDSAVAKLIVACALDPTDRASYWRRAWFLIGAGRYDDAAKASKHAKEKDPANAPLAAILPHVEKMAAARNDEERFASDIVTPVFQHLFEHAEAKSCAMPLIHRLKMSSEQRKSIVSEQVGKAYGKEMKVNVTTSGFLEVYARNIRLPDLAGLRGLPIDLLKIGYTYTASLEPLRGMRLTSIEAYNNAFTDLSPLTGMQLISLDISSTPVTDLSPLRGVPLKTLKMSNVRAVDYSALRGTPLEDVNMTGCGASNLGFLADAPIMQLNASGNQITDLSPLRGRPLKKVSLSNNRIADLSPLRGTPIEELSIQTNPIRDIAPLLELPRLQVLRLPRLGAKLEPLRRHPSLKSIACEGDPLRPVAEFWADFDAHKK